MPDPRSGESRDDFLERCIPIVLDDGTAEDSDQAVAVCQSMWENKMKREPGKVYIKSQDDGSAVIAGYGVVFGGEDLDGEYFDAETDFGLEMIPAKSVFYEHTQDLPQHALGKTVKEELDEVGIWIEAQLDKSKAYAEAVLNLIGEGVIGLSSGTASHLARRSGKHITRWPIVEYSLTPQPAEPRTLGVRQIKEMFKSAGLQVPEAFNEADEASAEPKHAEIESTKEKAMEDKEKEQPKQDAPVVDTKAIVAEVTAGIKAQQEADAEAEAKRAEEREEMKAELRAELEREMPNWKGGFNVSRIQHDDPNDDGGLDSFKHYLRTGDGGGYAKVMMEAATKAFPYWKNELAVKAALQGQTDAEGGYLVPDDFYNQIVAKRDDASVIRRAGATVIQTSLDRVLIPTEGTSLTAHAITAEEAAVDEEEPTFGQSVATIYKATKLIKVSEELVADEAANLLPFLNNALGRAEAAWENTYFVSQGNGSGQPNSGLNVSSVQVTASGTNSVTAAEVKELLFDLPAPYAESASAAIVGRRAVLGAISALTGNPFSFATMPAGDIQASRGQFGNVIDGIPYFSDETMPTFTTGNKVLLFADWSYYFVAERMGSMIQRLNELYAGNGQIGFLHKFRRGGVPTQSEAFIHLVTS